MICLTGDVHHIINSKEQQICDKTEQELAITYTEIARKNGLKITLFLTGKCAKDKEFIQTLQNFENLEIGGHTYSAFRPTILYKFMKKMSGKTYGPYFNQALDISWTIKAFKKRGVDITSWRTHAYASDANTVKILQEQGIKVISDIVKPNIEPKEENGVMILPINVLPDHEHLYHGFRTKTVVTNFLKTGWTDSFTNKSFSGDQWLKQVKEQIRENEKQGIVSTLIVHPQCMYNLNKFSTFKQLCKTLKGYGTSNARDIICD
ncbi:hypothetical protein COT72_03945 [archaeon CG10_big_fil_rev_8_21_14_0_10_43_11]|nr:MAG: hypothetical protein COT72_03945 [archaeon CG10_big_fil_rev_8_21_14_0_10_43_11]